MILLFFLGLTHLLLCIFGFFFTFLLRRFLFWRLFDLLSYLLFLFLTVRLALFLVHLNVFGLLALFGLFFLRFDLFLLLNLVLRRWFELFRDFSWLGRYISRWSMS